MSMCVMVVKVVRLWEDRRSKSAQVVVQEISRATAPARQLASTVKVTRRQQAL